jgi:hypothetical protein
MKSGLGGWLLSVLPMGDTAAVIDLPRIWLRA